MKASTLESYLGRTLPVLLEGSSGQGWAGYTPNFLRVSLDPETETDLENRIVQVKLSGLTEDEQQLTGERLKD
jgi:hypothetical protein